MRRGLRWAIPAGALALAGALAAGAELRREPVPLWKEVAWPFPEDPWGKGKAFECSARDCGAKVALYVRPKVGLCGCMATIEDDDLQRLSDLDLLPGEWTAASAGEPAQVRSLKGRSRGYLRRGAAPAGAAVAMAFHDRCDLVVATAAIDGAGHPERLTRAATDWLAADPVFRWIELKIGL